MKHFYRLTLLVVLVFALTPLAAGAQDGPSGWSKPLNFSESPATPSRFPLILCDSNQNLHTLWIENDKLESFIYYRTDAGGNWSAPADILRAETNRAGYLNAVIDANNIIHLTWLAGRPGGDMYYAQAPLNQMNDARAWTQPTILAHQVSDGALSIDSRGRLYVSYTQTDQDGLNHVGRYIYSDDGGARWSTPVQFFESATPVTSVASARLQVDEQGRYHVNWQERSFDYGVYSRIGYMRSTDEGKTWTRTVLGEANEPPGVDRVEVYLMGGDEVHLTWDEPERMHQWSSDGGETWSRPNLIVTLGWAFGGSNELVRDSAGALHAISGVAEGVYHTSWDNNNWVFPEIIAKVDNDPHGQKIAVCRGNELHVVYYDRAAEEEIWYSKKQVPGTAVAREGVPTPAAAVVSDVVAPQADTATPAPAGPAELTPTALPIQNAPPPPGATSELTALLLAILPVLGLIGIVFFMKKRR